MLQVLDPRFSAPDSRFAQTRYYLNDNLVQNTYDPQTRQSESAFTYLLSGLARAYTTNISDVLCIGLGVGIVPMDFARQGARVDVVEINPAVVPVGTRFFDLQTNQIHLTIGDGRHFLNRCRKQYDAVLLDAFLGDSAPSHLMTREAFESVRRVLRPGGVLVINTIGHLERGKNFGTASLSRTLRTVFPGVRIHSCQDGVVAFVATDHADPVFVHSLDFSVIHPDVLAPARCALTSLAETSPEDGRVLTDNFN